MRSAALLPVAACACGQTTEKQARLAISSMRVQGQVGNSFDFRVTSTDRSYNYKLRATWITPTVGIAAARLLELVKGSTEAEANEVRATVENRDSWLVLVELDPREGSGVVPRDWLAKFGPRGSEPLQVVGHQINVEGVWKSLVSGFPRDYSYDVFLLEFPRTLDGAPVLRPTDKDAELVVRIYNKQGRVRWKISPGIASRDTP